MSKQMMEPCDPLPFHSCQFKENGQLCLKQTMESFNFCYDHFVVDTLHSISLKNNGNCGQTQTYSPTTEIQPTMSVQHSITEDANSSRISSPQVSGSLYNQEDDDNAVVEKTTRKQKLCQKLTMREENRDKDSEKDSNDEEGDHDAEVEKTTKKRRLCAKSAVSQEKKKKGSKIDSDDEIPLIQFQIRYANETQAKSRKTEGCQQEGTTLIFSKPVHKPGKKGTKPRRLGKFRGNLCKDAYFFQNVQKHLTEKHIKYLDATPFKALFKAFTNGDICEDEHGCLTDEVLGLLSTYDGNEGFLIGGKTLKFTHLEVAVILGMPDKGAVLDYNGRLLQRRDDNDWIVKMFPNIKEFPKKRSQIDKGNRKSNQKVCSQHKKECTKDMIAKLVLEKITNKTPTDGEVLDVVKLLILYITTTILFTNSAQRVMTWVINMIDKLEDLCLYNWPKLVHHYLLDRIRECRKKNREDNRKSFIGGSTLTLMIWLCEHLVDMKKRKGYENKIPRIARYNLNDLSNILKKENLLSSWSNLQVSEEIENFSLEEKHILGGHNLLDVQRTELLVLQPSNEDETVMMLECPNKHGTTEEQLKQVHRLEENVQKLQQENDSLKKNLKEKNVEIENLEFKVKKLQEQNRDVKQMNEILEKQLLNTAELRKEKKDVEIENLKLKVKNLEEENKDVKQMNEILEKQLLDIQQLQKQNAEMVTQVDDKYDSFEEPKGDKENIVLLASDRRKDKSIVRQMTDGKGSTCVEWKNGDILDNETTNVMSQLQTSISERLYLSPACNEMNMEGHSNNRFGTIHLPHTSDPANNSTQMKKLLILDLNGLLVTVLPFLPKGFRACVYVANKPVITRPHCQSFLNFCFQNFSVGVWTSRTRFNMDRVVNNIMGNRRKELLFCWDQSHCTSTNSFPVGHKHKPLVFKELKKLWDKHDSNLPWEKGQYNESNTLLLDDSPYKAFLNPANTAIFPKSYDIHNSNDDSLGPNGDLRMYMERLVAAHDVQKHIQQNPFGQSPITKEHPHWEYYHKVAKSHNLSLST